MLLLRLTLESACTHTFHAHSRRLRHHHNGRVIALNAVIKQEQRSRALRGAWPGLSSSFNSSSDRTR
jgi:hypothetical protein